MPINHKSDCDIHDWPTPGMCSCGKTQDAMEAVITDCQGILTRYLVPNGITADEAIS